ncbi:MAG: hypothetical protein GX446_10635 [Chthonomonadales bacterium]|nr:hypothetical protein [Chthonomonadales bacterium]
MRNRSFVAAWLALVGTACAIVLPRTAATDTQPPVLGYACQQGCNNANGCSWPFGKYTVWNPHVECRITVGTITCIDSQSQVLCYSQWRYENADCTGAQIGDPYHHYTPDCVAQ